MFDSVIMKILSDKVTQYRFLGIVLLRLCMKIKSQWPKNDCRPQHLVSSVLFEIRWFELLAGALKVWKDEHENDSRLVCVPANNEKRVKEALADTPSINSWALYCRCFDCTGWKIAAAEEICCGNLVRGQMQSPIAEWKVAYRPAYCMSRMAIISLSVCGAGIENCCPELELQFPRQETMRVCRAKAICSTYEVDTIVFRSPVETP